MKIEDIEVEAITTEKTSALVTECLLKLYEKNAHKILDLNEEKKDREKEEVLSCKCI